MVVVKLVKPPDEGEKPVVPTAKFQVVEPPVVQVNVALVDELELGCFSLYSQNAMALKNADSFQYHVFLVALIMD